ncbi:MAG: histidinol dehydrogenase [Candidatus Hermodarchaeota archaeon]
MKKPFRVWKASELSSNWIKKRRIIVWEKEDELKTYVNSIISEVRKRGDEALVHFTKKFDKAILKTKNIRVTEKEIMDAYSKVEEKQISALEFMKKKVVTFEKHLLERISVTVGNDIKVHVASRPIPNVGCYVPGGEAAYPSTLIMTVAPAKVAQVPRVVVCSPPSREGTVNPLTLVAADICKTDEIYKVGGAQAIAALAYGTKTIKPVRKIVGPGNKFVTMAKLLVSYEVAIDMPAGPSEVLVLADKTANSRLVALDLISQAEHSAESVSGLITTSKKLAEKVVGDLKKIVPSLRRSRIINESFLRRGFIILCENMNEAINFTNNFAPEHLEIVTEKPMEVAEKIKSAGLILVGPYAPVSASDYCFGTNHVLPTGGFGHVFSGLSVLDFIKIINFIEGSKAGLLNLKENIRILAEAENLPNHFLAVEGRFHVE